METDPSVVEQTMAGVDEQTKDYSKLSSLMWRIPAILTKAGQSTSSTTKGTRQGT